MAESTWVALSVFLAAQLIALIVFYRKSLKNQIRRETLLDNEISAIKKQHQADKMQLERDINQIKKDMDYRFQLVQVSLDKLTLQTKENYDQNAIGHEKIMEILTDIRVNIAKINGKMGNGDKK